MGPKPRIVIYTEGVFEGPAPSGPKATILVGWAQKKGAFFPAILNSDTFYKPNPLLAGKAYWQDLEAYNYLVVSRGKIIA